MADQLSHAQERLMKLVNNTELAQLVGSTLAEIAVELMDAKQEAAHWKRSFETVRAELKVLASVAIAKSGLERLAITKADLAAVPENTELYVGCPEPGVRIYELREHRGKVPYAVEKILRPN